MTRIDRVNSLLSRAEQVLSESPLQKHHKVRRTGKVPAMLGVTGLDDCLVVQSPKVRITLLDRPAVTPDELIPSEFNRRVKDMVSEEGGVEDADVRRVLRSSIPRQQFIQIETPGNRAKNRAGYSATIDLAGDELATPKELMVFLPRVQEPVSVEDITTPDADDTINTVKDLAQSITSKMLARQSQQRSSGQRPLRRRSLQETVDRMFQLITRKSATVDRPTPSQLVVTVPGSKTPRNFIITFKTQHGNTHCLLSERTPDNSDEVRSMQFMFPEIPLYRIPVRGIRTNNAKLIKTFKGPIEAASQPTISDKQFERLKRKLNIVT